MAEKNVQLKSVEFLDFESSELKEYTVAWYSGSVDYVDTVLKVSYVYEENIHRVNPLLILDPKLQASSHYTRSILFSDSVISCDYGSYSQFILVKEGHHTSQELTGTLYINQEEEK